MNKNYNEKFWNILIGKFVFFHIHQCQEVHNSLLIQKNLNSARKIKVLNPKFFEIPLTLNDYQKFIQCCDLGREQIFSVLLKQNFSKSKILFYKRKFHTQ